MTNYLKYYHLEDYLFGEVCRRFHEGGSITPSEFYMIVIWKANRAKSRIRERLIEAAGTLDAAVTQICIALKTSSGPKDRLRILMQDWKFFLPMASAILAVLYPRQFTIYDRRVCEVLGDFEKLGNWQFSDKLWVEYTRFAKTVQEAAPHLSLRDADRHLWGQSFFEQVLREIASGTGKTTHHTSGPHPDGQMPARMPAGAVEPKDGD